MEETEAVVHMTTKEEASANGDNLVQGDDESMFPSAKRARIERELDVCVTNGGNNSAEGDDKSVKILSATEEKIVGKSVSTEKFHGSMKRVAEIVIVLTAMGQMRGARSPTDVERELIGEARKKLAVMSEILPPRELLSEDQSDALTEDLGLNRLSAEKVSAVPRLSIAEKLRLVMKKIEESRKLAAKSVTYYSQMQHIGHLANILNPNATDVSLKTSSDHTPVNQVVDLVSASNSHGHFGTNEAPGRTLETFSSSLSEVEPSHSTFPSTLPKHVKMKAGSDGMLNSAQSARATRTGDQMPGSSTGSSTQPHFASLDKVCQGMKMPDTTVGLAAHKDFGLISSQPVNKNSGSFVQSESSSRTKHQVIQHAANSTGSSSIDSNHNDIVRNIQRILHPGFQCHSDWALPSVAYMDSPLSCEVCKATITDTGSLLVCDACEKGVHVKCLHVYNQKGIPQGEWHCPKCLIKCLMLNNGKMLAPKYGRIPGNDNAPKYGRIPGNDNAPKLSNTSRLQSSVKNKIEAIDGKLIEQKLEINGGTTLYRAHVTKSSITQNAIADSKILNVDTSVPHLSTAIKTSHGEEQPANSNLIKENKETVSLSSISDAKKLQMEATSILQTEARDSTITDKTLQVKQISSENPRSLQNSGTVSADGLEPSKEFPT